MLRGSNSSTGIVFDLISEGPITLVDGASSVYLNRTPIANKSADVVTSRGASVTIPAGGASFTLRQAGNALSSSLQVNSSVGNKCLIHGGDSESTATSITSVSGENQSLVTTNSSFFTSAMLTPDGNGIYKEKIRIPGRGPEGLDYVGDVVQVNSATQAIVTPAIPIQTTPTKIEYDFYTTVSSVFPVTFGSRVTSYNVTLSSAIPNSQIHGTTGSVVLEGIDSFTNSNLNFDKARLEFKGGTLDQAPQTTVFAPSAATNITQIGTEIKQHTDYFGPATTKLENFWGKHRLEYPDGSTGGGEVTINAATVNQGSISEIDELLLTISFPSGLYVSNSKNEFYGALFQIFFDYKVGAGNYKTEQVFGPTSAEISAAQILVAANTGTFRKYGPRHPSELRSNSQTAVDFDFRFSIERFKPFTDFRVRIKKVTPDRLIYNDGATNFIGDSVIKTVTTIINDKLSYPFAGYAAISFDSNELNGEFPERAYHCRGVTVSVPSNYVTREQADDGVAKYTRNVSTGEVESTYQVWDGNLVRAYCDNPVWNLREVLVNKRWGLGHWMDDSSINDYSLYSLARYCDELVPDGQGGLEPRFTCGVYLTQPMEAYKVIKDFCSMMFALPYWVDGQLILEGDRKGEPVYTFTKGNVIDGVFTYEGTGNKTRPNQIVVQFNDRDNFYDQDIELVDDVEDMIQKNRIFSEEVVAFGATSRSQAIRYGKWKLLTSRMQKEMITFKTGINAAFLKPGSIVAVQDADRNTVRHSGRILNSTTSSITLDGNVSLPAGEEHTLYVQKEGSATYLAQESATISSINYTQGDIIAGVTTEEAAEVLVDDSGEPVTVQFVPDMHIVKRSITNTLPYSGSTLTVSPSFSSAPEVEYVWAVTSTRDGATVAGSAKNYRVLGIAEQEDGSFAISAIEHYNAKFDILDEEYLADPPKTVPRYDDIPPVTNFTASLTSNLGDNAESSGQKNIVLNWEKPINNNGTPYLDIASFRITHANPEGNIQVYDISPGVTNYIVLDRSLGTHEFKISAVSGFGPVSTPARTSIVLETGSSITDRLILPKGGVFNKPLQISGTQIVVPSEYTFTAASGKEVIVSGTAPTSPVQGDNWYDTVNDELKTWSSITESWET